MSFDPDWSNVVYASHLENATDLKGHVPSQANTNYVPAHFNNGLVITVYDATSGVNYPASADWDFSASDFTIEFWFNPTGYTGGNLIGIVNPTTDARSIRVIRWSGGASMYVSVNTILGSQDIYCALNGALDGVWKYWAITKSGLNIDIYAGDTPGAATTLMGSAVLGGAMVYPAGSTLNLFAVPGQEFPTLGILDDLRITKGLVRNVSVVPTVEFAGPPIEAGPPTIDSVTPGDSEVSVAFSPPADVGNGTFIEYLVDVDGIEATGPTSPIVVTGLTNGVEYVARVRYATDAGDGEWSADSDPFTPENPLPHPPVNPPPEMPFRKRGRPYFKLIEQSDTPTDPKTDGLLFSPLLARIRTDEGGTPRDCVMILHKTNEDPQAIKILTYNIDNIKAPFPLSKTKLINYPDSNQAVAILGGNGYFVGVADNAFCVFDSATYPDFAQIAIELIGGYSVVDALLIDDFLYLLANLNEGAGSSHLFKYSLVTPSAPVLVHDLSLDTTLHCTFMSVDVNGVILINDIDNAIGWEET